MKAPRPGRLLVLGFQGTEVPDALVSFAERFGLAGVILFRRNCPDAGTTAALIAAARARLSEVDPGWRHLVFVDQEGGRVERIPEPVPHVPPARELGQRGEEAVESLLRGQARALAQTGVDVNLAPVCDVLQEGESGDIGDRSFGSDPSRVGALAAAYVRGTLGSGICACAKHFPGLGSARVNSHRELPVVEKSWEEVEGKDLLPFRAVVGAGVPLVMAAHVVYPCLSVQPASLSPEWLKGVLRGRLRFRGAVISDDMEMGALENLGPPEDVALRAVRAGCDLLIYGRMLRSEVDPVAVADALGRELRPGEVSEAEARQAGIFGALHGTGP